MGLFDKQLSLSSFTPSNAVDTTVAKTIGEVSKFGELAVEKKLSSDLDKQLRRIKVAREQGKIDVDRANAEISGAVASIAARAPGLTSNLRKQAGEFFGTFGEGAAALGTTREEELNSFLQRRQAGAMINFGLDPSNPQDVQEFTDHQHDLFKLEQQKVQLQALDNKDVLYDRTAKNVGRQVVATAVNGSWMRVAALPRGASFKAEDLTKAIDAIELDRRTAIGEINSKFPSASESVRKPMIDTINSEYDRIIARLNDRKFKDVLDNNTSELVAASTNDLSQARVVQFAAGIKELVGDHIAGDVIKLVSTPGMIDTWEAAMRATGITPQEETTLALARKAPQVLAEIGDSVARVGTGSQTLPWDIVTANTLVKEASKRNDQLDEHQLNAANLVANNVSVNIPPNIAPQLDKGFINKTSSDFAGEIINITSKFLDDPRLSIVDDNGTLKLAGSTLVNPRFNPLGIVPDQRFGIGKLIANANNRIKQLEAMGAETEAAFIRDSLLNLHNIARTPEADANGVLDTLFSGLSQALPALWNGLKQAPGALVQGLINSGPVELGGDGADKAEVIYLDDNGDVIPGPGEQ